MRDGYRIVSGKRPSVTAYNQAVKAARLHAVTGGFKSVTRHNRFSRSSSYGGEPMVCQHGTGVTMGSQ
jgi:hypothetical protein